MLNLKCAINPFLTSQPRKCQYLFAPFLILSLIGSNSALASDIGYAQNSAVPSKVVDAASLFKAHEAATAQTIAIVESLAKSNDAMANSTMTNDAMVNGNLADNALGNTLGKAASEAQLINDKDNKETPKEGKEKAPNGSANNAKPNGNAPSITPNKPHINPNPKRPQDNNKSQENLGLPPSNFRDHEVPAAKDTVTLANFLEVVNGKWISDQGPVYVYFTPQFLMAFDDNKKLWSSSFIPSKKYGPKLYRIAGYDADNLILTCYPVDEEETFDNYVVFRVVTAQDNSLVLNIVFPNKDVTYSFERNLTKAEYKKLATILRSLVVRKQNELKQKEERRQVMPENERPSRNFNNPKRVPVII